MNGQDIPFRIDTGADLTVINERTARSLNLPITKRSQKTLYDAGGRLLDQAGIIETRVKRGNRETETANLYVIPRAPQNLLGVPEIEILELVEIASETSAVNKVLIEDMFPNLYKELGQLPDQFSIKLKETAEPYAISVPRKLPIGLREATEKELKRMEEMGVIERVEEPREWCAGMVVAPKSNGDVRICVDLTVLNKSVKRENFPLPRVEETLASLEGSEVFSKMDANSGFWQIELEENSRPYTTFITPFGRFQFKKMPFGISAAPEFFQRQMSKILRGLEGVECMMDDILVHGKNEREHDNRLEKVMKRIEEAGMTLNRKKCQFRVKQLIFLGHQISGKGISPDPEKMKAITEMRPPTNKTELKSFLGMVNYLHKFSPRLAHIEKPLRELNSKKSAWIWERDQVTSFEAIKREISQAPTLAKYNVRANHRITADSSSYALGAALLQENEEKNWQPVGFISRKLTEAERKYAQLEKEALAITWACEKFDFFLVGTYFQVETDHKPLVKLLGESDLANLPLRCQRFKMRLMRYHFEIFHTPGTQMYLADMLSRPAGEPTKQENDRSARVEMHVRATTEAEEIYDDQILQEIKEKGEKDEIYQSVIRQIQRGWRDKGKDYKGALQKYYSLKEHLTMKAGIIMRDEKIIIPTNLREEMIDRIHRGHQGVERCIRRAAGSMWWPGMRGDIERFVQGCNECIKNRKVRHYPLKTSELPTEPWHTIGTDLFEFKGKDYLVMVDYYSRWIEVAELNNKTSESVVKKMKSSFARLGYPCKLRSDNGPCYSATAFKDFVTEWKIEHQTSSPHYPESNGLAERSVQTVKSMWTKEKDKNLALLIYRNTPLESGKSPAELMIGRNVRTNIPKGNTQVSEEEFRMRDQELKQRQKFYADRKRRAKTQEGLEPGDTVWVKCSSKEKGERGMVISKREEPDSYDIRIRGKTMRRNRKHLRKMNMEQIIERPRSSSSEESESENEEEENSGEENSGEEDSQVDKEPEVKQAQTSRPVRIRSQKHLSTDYEWQ